MQFEKYTKPDTYKQESVNEIENTSTNETEDECMSQ